MRIVTILLMFITTLWASPVFATGELKLTAAEIQALPAYCAGRFAMSTNPAEYKRWASIYGPDFIHTHHMCSGIASINRYYRATTRQEKDDLLQNIVVQMNYMVQNARPGFKLMPDVYLYRSQGYFMMGKYAEAIADAKKVIELDPDQPAAYTRAIDAYLKIGMQSKALELASDGLRHIPNSTTLKKLYTQLGGKLPYPEPDARTAEAATSTENSQPSATDGTAAEKMTPQAKTALFNFSRMVGIGGGARANPAIKNSGGYVFVQVSEDPTAPDQRVLFKIMSQLPQPFSQVARIGIDIGHHADLFSSIKEGNGYLDKYWVVKRISGFSHAYWPNFNPEFTATFEAKDAKPYDPRSLSPGMFVTYVATLRQGKTIEDVVKAMNEGLRYDGGTSGLRFGVIMHHLLGKRPDERTTIQDDGGFLTGSLVQSTGLPDLASAPSAPNSEGSEEQQSKSVANAAVSNDDGVTPHPNAGDANASAPKGSSADPFCRFCPDEPNE